jgi:phosphatidylethanolamine/phosphatidyl-N-methylethanolamine N-methyltransferase
LKEHIRLHPSRAVRILELGPGTGVFTKALIKAMRHVDQLDVVELNESFYKMVHGLYHGGSVNVYHMNILDFGATEEYDFIFSSIPYRSLPGYVTSAIWKKKHDLAKCDGTIIYYKYVSPAPIFNTVERTLVNRHLKNTKIVWRNMPPAQLYTLQMDCDNGNGSAKTNRVLDLIHRFAPSTSG